MFNKELGDDHPAHQQVDQPQQNQQTFPSSINSQVLKKHDLSLPSGSPLLIKSKTEHIKELMTNKGFLKIRVNIPKYDKLKQKKIIGIDLSKKKSSKVLLVPNSYTMMQLISQIRVAYEINQNEAIFIYVNKQKMTNASAQLKNIYDRYVHQAGGQGIGILELNVYTNDAF